jgi:CelD/BcsL family acetyltransferase involved in cellulose biosynthesis
MNSRLTTLSTLTDPAETSGAQGTLRAEPIDSRAALEPHLKNWRLLAAGRPMRSPEWLLTWWETFAEPTDKLFVISVTDVEGRLVGLAPLYQQNKGRMIVLRVLGARDHCTHHTDWLSLPGYEKEVGRAVAQVLLLRQRDWQRLLFETVDEDASALRSTMEYLDEKKSIVHKRRINSCWKISLPPTWDDYLKTLSRSLRKRCRKLHRDYFETGSICLRQVEKLEDLPKGLALLQKLHAMRWGTPRQPRGVFSDPRFSSFHEKVARSLLTSGQLRLAWLERGGVPVAAEYQFFDEDTLYAYQAGLDVATGSYSGKLSMTAAIRFAIDHNFRWFDLLGGDEPYKANWRATAVECHDWRAWPRSFRGYGESACWRIYMTTAKGLKSLLPNQVIQRLLRQSSRVREFVGYQDTRRRKSFLRKHSKPKGADS